MTLITFAFISTIVSAIALIVASVLAFYYAESSYLYLLIEFLCLTVIELGVFKLAQNNPPILLLWIMTILPPVLAAILFVHYTIEKRRLEKKALQIVQKIQEGN